MSSRHIYGSHLRVTRRYSPTLTVTTSGLTGLHWGLFLTLRGSITNGHTLLVIGALPDHVGRRPVLAGAVALEAGAGIRFHRGPPRPRSWHMNTPKHHAGRGHMGAEEAPLLHRITGLRVAVLLT